MTDVKKRRVSKLYSDYVLYKKARKRKVKCCLKYTEKEGRYCKSCPVLYAMCHEARRDL